MPPNGLNPFDLVDDLRNAGFSDKQAEAQIKVLTAVVESELATKHDIELVKRDIKELELKIETIQDKQTLKIESIQDKQTSKIESLQDKLGLKIILSMTGVMAILPAVFGLVTGMLGKA